MLGSTGPPLSNILQRMPQNELFIALKLGLKNCLEKKNYAGVDSFLTKKGLVSWRESPTLFSTPAQSRPRWTQYGRSSPSPWTTCGWTSAGSSTRRWQRQRKSSGRSTIDQLGMEIPWFEYFLWPKILSEQNFIQKNSYLRLNDVNGNGFRITKFFSDI